MLPEVGSEGGILDWVIKILLAIVSFFTVKQYNDIENLKKLLPLADIMKEVLLEVEKLKNDSHECRLRLSDFKTDVSNNYAKDVNVQSSLARVHDSIEKVSDKLDITKDQISQQVDEKLDKLYNLIRTTK